MSAITGGKIWHPEAETTKVALNNDPMLSPAVKHAFISFMSILGIYVLIRYWPELLSIFVDFFRFVAGG